MKIRPNAEFCAAFPDDAIWDDDGELVQAGGRNVAEMIADVLRRNAYEVTSPKHQHEHGWDFEAKTRRAKFWLQVSDGGGEFSLMTQDWTLRLWPDRTHHARLLDLLDLAMRQDGRFSQIRWS